MRDPKGGDLPDRITGLPLAPRLSQERAKALVREQRAQMAEDVKRWRAEIENPTFRSMVRWRGFWAACWWAFRRYVLPSKWF